MHVVAPGEGFYASGRNYSYVPVRGSSFATPLVTATAALLFAQRVTDPWVIKQRIVATADPVPNLAGKVLGGLLNVRRAVWAPTVAVLTTDTGDEMLAEIQPPSTISVRWATGAVSVHLKDVRRMTKTLGRYRIVYFDTASNQLLIKDDVTWPPKKPWKFRYIELDNNNTRVGTTTERDLAEFADFVGPIM